MEPSEGFALVSMDGVTVQLVTRQRCWLRERVRPANSTTLIQTHDQYRYRLSLSFAGFIPSRRSSAGEYLPTDTYTSIVTSGNCRLMSVEVGWLGLRGKPIEVKCKIFLCIYHNRRH